MISSLEQQRVRNKLRFRCEKPLHTIYAIFLSLPRKPAALISLARDTFEVQSGKRMKRRKGTGTAWIDFHLALHWDSWSQPLLRVFAMFLCLLFTGVSEGNIVRIRTRFGSRNRAFDWVEIEFARPRRRSLNARELRDHDSRAANRAQRVAPTSP